MTAKELIFGTKELLKENDDGTKKPTNNITFRNYLYWFWGNPNCNGLSKI